VRIGLIADTHLPSLLRSLDDLGPQPAELLSSVDLILHAGDVTAPSVLEWCAQFADVLVAEGNNDLFIDQRMQKRQILDIEGWRIGMVHELRPESRPMSELLRTGMDGEHVDILVSGDTHVERLEHRDHVLLINSGSPILPHHLSTRLGTMGVLEISATAVTAQVMMLGHSDGHPNPCTTLSLHISEDHRRSRDARAPYLHVGAPE
jgi:putative phosphoesterase